MTAEKIIEVFKTNIPSLEKAAILESELLHAHPNCKINFDLEDCDRILRIEGIFDEAVVSRIARNLQLEVEALPD